MVWTVCTCSEFTYQAAGQIAASDGTSHVCFTELLVCDALVWPRSKKSLRRQSFYKKVIAVSSLIKTFDVYHLLEMNLQV